MYAILNQKPKLWSGRVVNVGLFKAGSLFMVASAVGVGNYAQMTVSNKLYFAVVANENPITTGTVTAQISQLQEVDLNQYPNGVKVTITQDRTQRFIFTIKDALCPAA